MRENGSQILAHDVHSIGKSIYWS